MKYTLKFDDGTEFHDLELAEATELRDGLVKDGKTGFAVIEAENPPSYADFLDVT